MGKVYKNQTALKLVATVGVDITSAAAQIKYIKPSGSTGSFTATISDATTGKFEYIISDENDIDEVGSWVLWGYVVFSDETYAAGEPYILKVYSEGT